MCILFYLGLAVTLLSAVDSLDMSDDFCKQGWKWKANVNVYVNNCIRNTNELLSGLISAQQDVKVLKNHSADHIFNLRNQENLTSAADLYQELTTFKSIFLSFHSAMSKYKTGSPIVRVDRKRQTYLDRLSTNINQLNKTIETLSEKLNVSSYQANEATSSVGAGCFNKPQDIYICSYYVTEKLNTLLKQWANNSAACLRLRKGNSSPQKAGKGKKNKGNKKGQKKVNKGGKGKGKGKRNKNSDNKRNKSQGGKTQ